MIPLFGPAGRKSALQAMADEPVDLLVIGGGITGCGLARDAALRGLRVALVERDDFGAGTSSRSSKLVHGGARYLNYFDFRMVTESVRERRVLRSIAPHLVHPLPFLFPVHPGTSLTKFRLGFWLYDQLADASDFERHQVLTAREVQERIPFLRMATGGIAYGEYITDDARFTLENAQSAAQHGALVVNHAPVTGLCNEGGYIAGARVRDAFTGEEYTVGAAVVVNATGPWAEQTLLLGHDKAPKQLLPSKGAHIILRADRLPLVGAVALNAPSGQEGFAIRRWDYVYVGTTDVAHSGPLDRVTADREAVRSLLELANACFPEMGLSEADVVGYWAGLRPLIAEEGKAPRDTSRHDEVWRSPDGLLTIAGGKLTTYRPMAARVMKHVEQELGRRLGDNRLTAEVPLPGAGPAGQAPEAFRGAMQRALAARGVSPQAIRRITWLYGAQVQELLRMGDEDPSWLAPLAPGVPALRGEVRLAVEQEMAMTLADFMDRRSALLLFSDRHGLDAAEPAAGIMAALLGWSEGERIQAITSYHEFAEAYGAAP